MNDTFFSSRAFVADWCANFGANLEPFPIGIGRRDDGESAFAVATIGRMGLWSVSFGPEGFYGSPGWEDAHCRETVAAVLARLQSRRVRKFVWNVRFDHAALAKQLAEHIPDAGHHTTQVLQLTANYEQCFARFNATVRNQVRKAQKSGVVVRQSSSFGELQEYYAIHQKHVARRAGYDFVYPLAFLWQLIQPNVGGRLLLATIDEKIAAGGIFVRDGNSVYYFHSAYDPQFSRHFPTCAVIDEAIRWSHEIGAATFNLGGSAGIASLEQFKSFWGAETVPTWRFTWRNPLWIGLDSAARWIKNLAHCT
jgi:hypothetical protein